jgi:hypothetical protein
LGVRFVSSDRNARVTGGVRFVMVDAVIASQYP